MKPHKLIAAVISLALCFGSTSAAINCPASGVSAAAPTVSVNLSRPDLHAEASAAKTTSTTTKSTTTKTTSTTTKSTTPKTTSTTTKSTTPKTTSTTTKSTTPKTTSTTTKSTTSKTTTTVTTTQIPLMLGDIDNDKKITGSDATMILSEYTLLSSSDEDTTGNFTSAQKIAGDINKDGNITGSDATLTLSYYTYSSSGGILEFPDYLKYGAIDIPPHTTTTTTSTTTTTTATTSSTTTTTVSTSSETSVTSSTETTTTTYSDPDTVQKIELSKYDITVHVGNGDISYVKMLPATAPQTEKWWSSDTDIATVDGEGWIMGIAPGECTVTVQSVNNPDVTAEIKVTVIDDTVPVQEIKLDKYELTLKVGMGDMPLVTMLPSDASDKSEIWTSSDTDIATVNYEGWIMGIAPGECTVTVQSASNPDVKAEVKVTVIDDTVPVREIKLDKYEIVIKAGMGDMPLVTMLPSDASDKSEIWTSSDTDIADVNFEGWIMGITPGECTVTVQSAFDPDIKAVVKVIVIK